MTKPRLSREWSCFFLLMWYMLWFPFWKGLLELDSYAQGADPDEIKDRPALCYWSRSNLNFYPSGFVCSIWYSMPLYFHETPWRNFREDWHGTAWKWFHLLYTRQHYPLFHWYKGSSQGSVSRLHTFSVQYMVLIIRCCCFFPLKIPFHAHYLVYIFPLSYPASMKLKAPTPSLVTTEQMSCCWVLLLLSRCH